MSDSTRPTNGDDDASSEPFEPSKPIEPIEPIEADRAPADGERDRPTDEAGGEPTGGGSADPPDARGAAATAAAGAPSHGPAFEPAVVPDRTAPAVEIKPLAGGAEVDLPVVPVRPDTDPPAVASAGTVRPLRYERAVTLIRAAVRRVRDARPSEADAGPGDRSPSDAGEFAGETLGASTGCVPTDAELVAGGWIEAGEIDALRAEIFRRCGIEVPRELRPHGTTATIESIARTLVTLARQHRRIDHLVAGEAPGPLADPLGGGSVAERRCPDSPPATGNDAGARSGPGDRHGRADVESSRHRPDQRPIPASDPVPARAETEGSTPSPRGGDRRSSSGEPHPASGRTTGGDCPPGVGPAEAAVGRVPVTPLVISSPRAPAGRWTRRFERRVRRGGATIAPGLHVHGSVHLDAPGGIRRLTVGRNVTIGRGVLIRLLGTGSSIVLHDGVTLDDGVCIQATGGGRVVVGAHGRIGAHGQLTAYGSDITVGRDTILGGAVTLGGDPLTSSAGSSTGPSAGGDAPAGEGACRSRSIVLGERVEIGPGVHVAEGTAIGSGVQIVGGRRIDGNAGSASSADAAA